MMLCTRDMETTVKDLFFILAMIAGVYFFDSRGWKIVFGVVALILIYSFFNYSVTVLSDRVVIRDEFKVYNIPYSMIKKVTVKGKDVSFEMGFKVLSIPYTIRPANVDKLIELINKNSPETKIEYKNT